MKPLPAHLPPLPAGAVYLGLGGTFHVPASGFGGYYLVDTTDYFIHSTFKSGVWEAAPFTTVSDRSHYACRADGSAARLNATVEPQSVHIVWSASRQEPTKTHPSRESAIAEAKRLCAKHPAHEFFVFERVAGFKGTVTVESI